MKYKYISNIYLYCSVGLLFSYFSFFLRIDQSSFYIKSTIFIIPIFFILTSFLLFSKKSKISYLVEPINIVLFGVVFIVSSFLSANLYSNIIYFNLDNEFKNSNYILPKIPYEDFKVDRSMNNRDRLFFYLENKGYINSIEEKLNYQTINLIKTAKDSVMTKELLHLTKDDVITEFEFNNISEILIENFNKVKEDKELYELYKLTFVFGKNYGNVKNLSSYPY